MKVKRREWFRISKKVLSSVIVAVMILAIMPCGIMVVSAASAPWNGSLATSFAGGNGTEANPYIISTAEQLAFLADRVNRSDAGYKSACYKLSNDIVINDPSSTSPKNWTMIGDASRFYGTFDGNDYAVIGLYGKKATEDDDGDFGGLFGYINNAVIKNVTIKSASITTDKSTIGFVAGYAEGGTISNCHVDANSKIDIIVDHYVDIRGFAGGIVGSLAYNTTMEISGCSFAGSIVAEAYLGGIIGYNSSDAMLTITDCETLAGASLTGNLYIGGILGHSYGNYEIRSCTNNASVNGVMYLGGILGKGEQTDTQSQIISCNNNGKITSSDNKLPDTEHKQYSGYGNESFSFQQNIVGGIAGNTSALIASCTNSGVIEGDNDCAGIVCFGANIVKCTNNAPVNGAKIGGIATGAIEIIECVNNAAITVSGGGAGGIAFKANYIAYCVNNGDVYNDKNDNADYVGNIFYNLGYQSGGIAGLANEVVGCTNNGSVYSAPFAGGIIGDHRGSIKNCINNGDVSSVFGAGGIFGVCYKDSATTSYCYSVGDVSGNVYSGGIAGCYLSLGTGLGVVEEYPTVVASSCFYLDTCIKSGSKTSGGTSDSTAGLRTDSTISALGDFFVPGGVNYPKLIIDSNPPTPTNDNGEIYRIYSAGQLSNWSARAAINMASTTMSAMLMNDIYLYDEWTPIVNFKGTMDGNGKTIYGLTITDLTKADRGLFSKVEDATIKNLTISGATVKGDSFVGAICGNTFGNTSIQNCSVVNSEVYSEHDFAGGIVGYTHGGEVSKCFSSADVASGAQYSGGIVGKSECPISYCYSTGNVNVGLRPDSRGDHRGAIAGEVQDSISNCYFTNQDLYLTSFVLGSLDNNYHLSDTEETAYYSKGKTAAQFASGEVCYLLNKGITDGTQAWYQTCGEGIPALSGETVYKMNAGECTNTSDVYTNEKDGASTHNFIDGICSLCGKYQIAALENNIYQISNYGQLMWFAALVNGDTTLTGGEAQNTAANAVLVDDITIDNRFTPIATYPAEYIGQFDGQGHTLTFAVTAPPETDRYGLFGTTTTNAKISNLKLDGSITSTGGWTYAGALAGASFATPITNVISTADIENKKSSGYTGGLVGRYGGREKSVMSYCGVSADITGPENVGGIIGAGWDGTQYYAIKDCFYVGNVKSETNSTKVGAVVGYSETNNSNYYGKVTIQNVYYSGVDKAVGSWKAAAAETAAQISNVNKVSASDFASGAVTYALNGNRSVGTEESPLIWYQTVGVGIPSFSGDTVYYGYENCASTEKTYSNTPFTDGEVPHKGFDENGFCTGCGAYQPITPNGEKIYEITNAGQMYWFANEVNGGNVMINGKLTEDINLNPGYTFTFDSDTGLVTVAKDGNTVVYIGTGIKGDASGENAFFDTSASSKGRFYQQNDSDVLGTKPEDLRDWIPISSSGKTYSATFDGNGKTVSGMYFNNSLKRTAALFGDVGINGIIKNLTVAQSIIVGSSSVGGVSGSNGGIISGCQNFSTIIGGLNTGGVSGINSGIIRNCQNSGAVCGSSSIGGVCGYFTNGSIENCFNIGKVVESGKGNSAGIVGNKVSGTVSNCYFLDTSATCGMNANIDSDSANISPEGQAEGKTAAQFASGSVAWLLNTAGKNSGDEGYTHSGVWSQGAEYPIFADETNKAIYKVTLDAQEGYAKGTYTFPTNSAKYYIVSGDETVYNNGDVITLSKDIIITSYSTNIEIVSATIAGAVINAQESITATLIYASYKGKKLLNTDIQEDITIAKGENEYYPTANFSTEGADKVIVMIWENPDKIEPLCKAVIVDIVAE